MTHRNADVLSPKACALAEKCLTIFPELEVNVDFLQEMERLVCFSYVRHIVSNTSFIRQMNVIAFPGKDRQIAQIYLLIDDGRVHGLKLTGISQQGVDCVSQMVDELESLVRADDGSVSVEHKKARLAALINQKSHHDLTVWTFEREEYAPSSGFLKSARRSIIVSLRALIQAELTRKKNETNSGNRHSNFSVLFSPCR